MNNVLACELRLQVFLEYEILLFAVLKSAIIRGRFILKEKGIRRLWHWERQPECEDIC